MVVVVVPCPIRLLLLILLAERVLGGFRIVAVVQGGCPQERC